MKNNFTIDLVQVSVASPAPIPDICDIQVIFMQMAGSLSYPEPKMYYDEKNMF